MDRLEDNRKILQVLSKLVEENPELRFGQMLINAMHPKKIEDMFYVESSDLLKELLNEKILL